MHELSHVFETFCCMHAGDRVELLLWWLAMMTGCKCFGVEVPQAIFVFDPT